MRARAVGLPNDQKVVFTDARSTNDLNFEACPRVQGIVKADKLYELFVGSMSLLRRGWARRTWRSRSA